jgi:hypothetical protein
MFGLLSIHLVQPVPLIMDSINSSITNYSSLNSQRDQEEIGSTYDQTVGKALTRSSMGTDVMMSLQLDFVNSIFTVEKGRDGHDKTDQYDHTKQSGRYVQSTARLANIRRATRSVPNLGMASSKQSRSSSVIITTSSYVLWKDITQ